VVEESSEEKTTTLSEKEDLGVGAGTDLVPVCI
jgi:hypothetical protein